MNNFRIFVIVLVIAECVLVFAMMGHRMKMERRFYDCMAHVDDAPLCYRYAR